MRVYLKKTLIYITNSSPLRRSPSSMEVAVSSPRLLAGTLAFQRSTKSPPFSLSLRTSQRCSLTDGRKVSSPSLRTAAMSSRQRYLSVVFLWESLSFASVIFLCLCLLIARVIIRKLTMRDGAFRGRSLRIWHRIYIAIGWCTLRPLSFHSSWSWSSRSFSTFKLKIMKSLLVFILTPLAH